MDAKLVVAKGKTTVKEIPLAGISTIIGRRNDCSLRIPSPLVSRQHCELTQAANRLIVKDLGSSNGTFVNGARVKQKELKSGDTLGVGPITFIVQLGGARISPADTAGPHTASAVAEVGEDDVADFVVAAEEATAEEVVEAADFVVGEEASAEAVEEAADFVAAEEEAPSTGDTEIADFVVSEQAAGDGEADFVVAEEQIPEGETVHDMNITEFNAEDQQGEPAAAEAVVEAAAVVEAEAVDEAAPETQVPKKKAGIFGRLFKKKEKKSPAKAQAAAQPPPPPAPTKTAAPASPSAEADMPEFFDKDEPMQSASAKPVGEDEMADFLMGLNEKEE